jgi:hypothetical protein
MTGKHMRMFRTALIGAYIAIPPSLALGTYLGWLFQSRTPNTNIAVCGLIALVAATIVAEYAGVFERVAAGRDILKGIAYCLGSIVWVAAVVRSVPDNSTGATVLIGPFSALMLAGVFYLSRFVGTCTRSWTAAIMTSAPTPMAPPDFGSSTSQEIPVWSGGSPQSDQVDIAANRRKIAVRLLVGAAMFLILAQVARGSSYGSFASGAFYVGAIFVGAMALRSLPRRAPALSLASDGISIRRDLCAIRHLPWSEIISFEMKSAMANTFLVIQVRNANALIAQCGPISRWMMGQSQAMFGSPVRIPVAWLECDPNWLWQTVNKMLVARKNGEPSRMSQRPLESNR